MAPIYDTDLGQQRWEKTQWEQVELYEQIQKRERRKRFLWIALAVVLFLIASSILVFQDRYVKWKSMRAARVLATSLQQMKTLAAKERTIYQMELTDSAEGGLSMLQYPVKNCGAAMPKEGVIHIFLSRTQTYLTAEAATKLGLENIASTLCYDPLKGFTAENHAGSLVTGPIGIAIGPANDLTTSRLDRFSTLLIDGESAEISFD